MLGQRETVEALLHLVRAPGLLMSHVFIDYIKRQYVVRDDKGATLLIVNQEEAFKGEHIIEVIEKKVDSMLCAECQTILLEGEVGVCGPCEAKTVMALLRLGRSF